MNRTEQLVAEIVDEAHPKMAESIRMAALPQWYDLRLFAAIRNVDDGRNEGIIQRLIDRYSFVLPVPSALVPTYHVRDEERVLLNVQWIEQDRSGYLDAHRRAFHYYRGQSHGAELSQQVIEYESIVEEYPQLYHHFFVDLHAANRELILLFRELYKWRKIGAIDNLLGMLDEVHQYLELLHRADRRNGGPEEEKPDSAEGYEVAFAQFNTLRKHYRARALQLRGKWQESLNIIRPLRFAPDLPTNLAPYVIRSYGSALARTGQYVDGILQLSEALKGFGRLPADDSDPHRNRIERAYTMIEMGESYVAFARAVRGTVSTKPEHGSVLQRFRNLLDFLFNGPLILYLSRFLGMRVWLPGFWPTLRNLDWIVARLFAKAIDLYKRADLILETYQEAPDEHLIADEKLGFLYVGMGDVQQARNHFEQILNDPNAKLTQFQRAVASMGLAWALVQSGQYEPAIALLEITLPVLEGVEAETNVANASALLAQAYMAMGNPQKSVAHFTESLERYLARNQAVRATNLVEILEQLIEEAKIEDAAWVSEAEELLAQASAVLEERVYEVGYRHPILTSFRQLVGLFIPAALVLSLLMTFNLDTQLALQPTLTVDVPPLLDPTQTVSAQISQGVTQTQLSFDFDPQAGILWSSLFVAGFFLLSLIFGVAAIVFSPLARLQRQQDQEVTISADAIEVRQPDKKVKVSWRNLSHWVKADIRLWDRPMLHHSATAFCSRDASAILPGTTNAYETVVKRLSRRLKSSDTDEASISEKDVGFYILRSWSGILYGLNLLLLAGLLWLLLSTRQAASDLLWRDFPGTPYSLTDLYPYLYLVAVLIPVSWTVLRPLHILLHIQRPSRLPDIVIGGGLLVTLVLVVTLFRPLFTVPDLYPTLVVVPSMAMASYAIWRLKDGQDAVYSLWVRVSAVVATLLITILLVGVLQRDVRAYHYLILGNSARDQEDFERAISHYQRATEIGREKAWGIFDPVSALRADGWPNIFGLRIGLPDRDKIIWFTAQKNLAALQSQTGRHLQAIDNYTEIIEVVCPTTDETVNCDPGQEKFLAWRAMARSRAVTRTGTSGEIATTDNQYELAIRDYNAAIALDPDNPRYYLWKGFASQTIDNFNEAEEAYEMALERSMANRALQLRIKTFQGWLALEQKQYAEAVNIFTEVIGSEQAVPSGRRSAAASSAAESLGLSESKTERELDAILADAERGLGYASYEWARQGYADSTNRQSLSIPAKLQLYESAEAAWRGVIQRTGESRELLQSLATVHWAKAPFTAEPCSEWAKAAELFEASLRFEQPDAQRAFTYRSLAQIQYLLGRDCGTQGYSKEAQYRLAIASYSGALDHSLPDHPLHAYYVHMRARITHELWAHLPGTSPEEKEARLNLLLSELVDLRKALELDGEDHLISLNSRADVASPFDYRPNEFGVVAVSRALASIEQAILSGDEDVTERLWPHLEALLPLVQDAAMKVIDQYTSLADTNADRAELVEWRALLEESLKLFAQDTPLMILVDAHRAYMQGNWVEAQEIYAQRRADLVGIDLTRVSIPGARQLAGLALLSGDVARAAYWYALLMVRVGDADYGTYTAARSDLHPIWQNTEIAAGQLLVALEDALTETLQLDPDKENDGFYWSLRAWFKFRIGQEAFLAGDEETARQALEVAQPDADRAFALGYVGRDSVSTYLLQGAWGWYYTVRGDENFAAQEYETAFENYATAFEAFQPVDNLTAQAEHVGSALKAGLTSLVLGRTREARLWYNRAFETAEVYEANPQVAETVAAAARTLEVQPVSTAAARALKAQLLARFSEFSP